LSYGADSTTPEENIDAGTRYLRVLIDRYWRYRGWMRRVIAAYNAGTGVVDRYRGVLPYRYRGNTWRVCCCCSVTSNAKANVIEPRIR
jgi:soluble lytic murein transglycosylase-like protein